MDSIHLDMDFVLSGETPEYATELLPRQHDVTIAGRYLAAGVIGPLQGPPLAPEETHPCGRCGLEPSAHLGWEQGHLWIRRLTVQ
ncbi:hypothetical protein ACWGIV_36985 [Streptomyces sp. NPDC054844]